jgi:phospho-N-acetylmuramoyl-pentapeptide-transferase
VIPEILTIMTAFWIALVAAAVAAKPVHSLLLAMKSRQTVSQYAPEGHQKKQGTPTMGGLIICIGFLVAVGYFWLAGSPDLVEWATRPHPMLVALVLFAGFTLIGFVDDFVVPRMVAGKRGLGWKQKIIMELVVAALASGLLFNWYLGFGFWLAIFLILFFSNAYNFSDGLDGLAGTLLIALGFGLLSLAWHGLLGVDVGILIGALLGAIIPFLYLNAPPAKVFTLAG